MRRREFLGVLGSVAAGWPVAANAQPSAPPIIGYLHPFEGSLQSDLGRFAQGLNKMGFVEGSNITIDFRYAKGSQQDLPALAAELVRKPVSVIVTGGGVTPALAAKRATSSIPIVFVHGSDPVKTGLVGSLNRPGGNVTGVTFVTGVVQAKAFELLRDALPGPMHVAALVNPRTGTGEDRIKEVEQAARTLGIRLSIVKAGSPNELNDAFAQIVKQQARAVMLVADPLFRNRHVDIVALANQYSLPMMGFGRDFAEAGALMSYGADLGDSFREAGVYVGRILKGESPSNLPVLQPVKFELVLNMKTAKRFGFEFSSKLLALADDVIE
jgi:putative ABC transport system substrate-binding protein